MADGRNKEENWILFQGPTVPSPPQARIRRFGTFLYSSSLWGNQRKKLMREPIPGHGRQHYSNTQHKRRGGAGEENA